MGALSYLKGAELEREINEVRGFIVASIPAGADATNDYWRARLAALLKERNNEKA